MELTKEEKIAAYTYALAHVDKEFPGVCTHLIGWLHRYMPDRFRWEPLSLLFPEFANHRPHFASTFWWPNTWYGRRKRRRILSKIIKELEYAKT